VFWERESLSEGVNQMAHTEGSRFAGPSRFSEIPMSLSPTYLIFQKNRTSKLVHSGLVSLQFLQILTPFPFTNVNLYLRLYELP